MMPLALKRNFSASHLKIGKANDEYISGNLILYLYNKIHFWCEVVQYTVNGLDARAKSFQTNLFLIIIL